MANDYVSTKLGLGRQYPLLASASLRLALRVYVGMYLIKVKQLTT